MPGPGEEEGGSFATALRATREALERVERDARQKAAEIIQQAQEQAQRIQAEAEAAAQLRARVILDEAEERARQLPAQLLPGLIGQVDDARILFGEIRHRLQALLESRGGDAVANTAPAGPGLPVAAPIASSGLDSPKPPPDSVQDPHPPVEAEEEDEPTLHKPGAHTIVRGLRVQMLEEMMQKQGGGQKEPPAPPVAAPPPAPAPAESSDEPRRRWPFG